MHEFLTTGSVQVSRTPVQRSRLNILDVRRRTSASAGNRGVELRLGLRELWGLMLAVLTGVDCLQKIAPTVTPDAFVKYWFEMDSKIDQELLHDCEVLRRSDVRVFLATNQEHLRADYLMNDLGLSKHVDGIAISAVLGARKPQFGFFQAAATHCGCTASELVLVDDTLENVQAARDAGWEAVRWTGRDRLIELLQIS